MSNKIVQDLWILSESGIVIFSRVFNPTVKEQLFGALMTALNSFASELASGGLTSFELSNMRFTIQKQGLLDQAFLFICNSSKKVKEKKIFEELKLISERFFELYKDVLVDWDNDVSYFSNFEEKIEDSLEETIKKFQKAFW